jgi:ABC-type molybdate transport system substrate-binding protein
MEYAAPASPPHWPRRGLMLGALAAFAASPAWAEWLRDDIVVYAEPALAPVLGALSADFRRIHPGTPRLFTAPPAQMLGLLAHNTQADMLIAQSAFMDRAASSGLTAPGPPPVLWRNRLVLATTTATPMPDFNAAALSATSAGAPIAAPDPSDASTIDGPRLLAALGITARVQGTAATQDALDMLRAGTASLALCTETELLADPALHRAATLPDGSYPAITASAALTKTAWSRNQMALLDFLRATPASRWRGLGLERVG